MSFGEPSNTYERELANQNEYERKREKELKDRLVQFSREQILDQEGWQRINDPEYPYILYGRDRAGTDDLAAITAGKIDRTNPELWKLKRSIQNSYHNLLPDSDPGGGGFGVLDRLEVDLTNGPAIEIHPDFLGKGETFREELGKYLSEEDLTFLMNEYRYTAQDLERTLRAVADRIMEDPQGTSRMMKNFFPKEQGNSSPERTLPAR